MIHNNTEQITETFARQFLASYLKAWNSRIPQNILALASEDVIWEDPTIFGGRAAGHEAVQIWLKGFWNIFPDMTFEFLDGLNHESPESGALSFGRKSLIAPWRCKGTWLGTINPPGLIPNGSKLDITGVDLYAFRDGKVCHVRTITDLRNSMQQMGLVPSPGSFREKAAAAMQRLVSSMKS